MGLIDDIRKKRDSWMGRLEEHRQDEGDEEEYYNIDREMEEAEILKNRKIVGVFPRKDQKE
ncbi:MAG: hypothetical protein C4291_06555 [Candidatus Dadabacteria bacterium]